MTLYELTQNSPKPMEEKKSQKKNTKQNKTKQNKKKETKGSKIDVTTDHYS